MKHLFTSILLFVSFTAYMPIKKSNAVNVNEQIKTLISEGYSTTWAIKKALVENNILKADNEYYAIIED